LAKLNKIRLVVIFSLLVALGFFHFRLINSYKLPYVSLNETLWGRYGLQDVGFILAGFRSAAADVAWVQLYQYVGGSPDPEEDLSRPYDFIKPMSLRIIRLDPYYRAAYKFSAGILAWFKSVNRPDEAVYIVQDGIKNEPNYWPYHLYMGAIAYRKSKQYGKMLELLEQAAKYPDCPTLIKAILANGYKAAGKYRKALLIWLDVLETGSPDYYNRAREQIELLKSFIAKG